MPLIAPTRFAACALPIEIKSDTDFRGEPSVVQQVSAGQRPAPVGFTTGYGAFSMRLHGSFDTRDPRGLPAGVIHKTPSQHLCSHAEKMSAILPVDIPLFDEQ